MEKGYDGGGGARTGWALVGAKTAQGSSLGGLTGEGGYLNTPGGCM